VISYILAVDSADLSAINVEMSIHNIPDTFKIAMVAHPEYDDKYWRFVEDLHVETKNGKGDIKREDSALWRVEANGGAATISYRIHFTPEQTCTESSVATIFIFNGGLIGGVHSFMYVVSATLAPAYVTLRIPHGWNAVTGLEPTSDPYTFFAPSVGILVDGPILIGKFKKWVFRYMEFRISWRIGHYQMRYHLIHQTS
jgi:predicted metalloprotease with PDZ domain